METHCHHMAYSFRLAASVLLYAPSHRQDNTYHCLYYTSRGGLAGMRNSSPAKGNLLPHYMGYPFWLTAINILCVRCQRQNSTYYNIGYTSYGALAGTRISLIDPHHEWTLYHVSTFCSRESDTETEREKEKKLTGRGRGREQTITKN